MTIFESNIPQSVLEFFKINLKDNHSIEEMNQLLKNLCGIDLFFQNETELKILKNSIHQYIPVLEKPNRRAYGDFQTNELLAQKIVRSIEQKGASPEFLIEPTCGKGRFILAALQQFKSLQKIVGIEIYFPYVWETKFKILDLFLHKKNVCQPIIKIIHENIFNFDLENLSKKNKHFNVLIIGNPPWVTNSELGTLNSNNLPKKSNSKNHKGIDAITGKGNFDIAEYISVQILKHFDYYKGEFAFLVKNSVVKNILHQQKKSKYRIHNIQKLNIDTKKEFNAAVDACLFSARLGAEPTYICREIDFYSQEKRTVLGWCQDKFVYSIEDYNKLKNLEGKSPFVWRQGMKHDCSKIMEMNRLGDYFINRMKEKVVLEPHLLHGLLKSSDLKDEMIHSYRKTTIVTQKKVGQDTSYIQKEYPKTYDYLNKNKTYFTRRKSSIYKNKPPFSIFGIGDYSFKKYKVAISGMYRKTTFSLVPPFDNKPLMLDDTCYFIGFDTLAAARIAQAILNSDIVQDFIKTIIFPDAKRPITKDILMRIDLEKAYNILKLKNNFLENSDWSLFENQIS